jgi:transposase-like protein
MAWLTKTKCPECGAQLRLEEVGSNPTKAAAKLLCDNCQAVYEKNLQTGELKLLYKLKRKDMWKMFFGI